MRTLKNTYFFAVIAALTLVFCLGGQAFAQSGSIGVVNIDKALLDSKKGKTANDKFKAKQESLLKDLETKAKALEKKVADFDKQAPALAKDAFEKKQQELIKERDDFLNLRQKANEEIEKLYNDSMKPLLDKAMSSAAQIGQDRGLMMIVDVQQAGVVYYQNSIDLTADVSKAIDK
ncbi:MAG: OmpH family outer membrane protein [Deltaproteobacteria bacterium]|jgi:outer membrane protein|nr:OmpH family outer membrane protein [Deltaproteobacteria bacterium]